MTEALGEIVKISGPVVCAQGLLFARLNDVVYVGREGLIGEIIRIRGDYVTIQVYEETSGIALGEPVRLTHAPLTVELGPGLLGQVYDGLQRPLRELQRSQGDFLKRGTMVNRLSVDKKWNFEACITQGSLLKGGDILGLVQENANFLHPILLPPGLRGVLDTIQSGVFAVDQPFGILKTDTGLLPLTLKQVWPVRQSRPVPDRDFRDVPLVTGTRIIDLLFPINKGGTAVIPGGFGTGKTVTQQSLARWADVDIVVYIGCGERGNEMAEVLSEFPQLKDPRYDRPLIERTVLIANTSNMPVAAREASIYTGMAIAEYFREIGNDVLVLADSTSRWAEALREISSQLEEIPGEEGYPAYLSSRLAAFYERSGGCRLPDDLKRFKQKEFASVSLVGAISPPGSDFSEPVTQGSLRVSGAFWALDYALSRRRHFPAINWQQSYSLYDLSDWFQSQVAEDFPGIVRQIRNLLARENTLLDIVQIIGQDTLSEAERLVLWTARMVREDLLQQSALDEIDRYCSLEKGYWMIKTLHTFYLQAVSAIESGISLELIKEMAVNHQISRMKFFPDQTALSQLQTLHNSLPEMFKRLKEKE